MTGDDPMRCDRCSVEGCDKPRHARDMCQMHYSRWKRHGDTEPRRRPNRAHGTPSKAATGCECDACCQTRARRAEQSRLGRVRARSDPQTRAHLAALTQSSKHRAYRNSLQAAGRSGYEWTGPELELAARTDLTPGEVASMIGRTYYAVKLMRTRLLNDPKIINLVGLSKTGPTGRNQRISGGSS